MAINKKLRGCSAEKRKIRMGGNGTDVSYVYGERSKLLFEARAMIKN